jgi:CRP-like cAMP-binding protein
MEIINILNGINPMSPELIDQLSDNLKTTTLKTGEYLLRAGEVCRNVYFVQKGLLRSISLEDSKEVSNWFMGENDVVYAVESFLKQEASKESIQALEDCTLYYITYSELQDIYRNFSEFNWHGRVLTEKYYLLNMERSSILANPDRDQRYRLLWQSHRAHFNRVQNEYLASYLGVSLRTLLRLKKRAKKGAGDKKLLNSLLLALLSLLYR